MGGRPRHRDVLSDPARTNQPAGARPEPPIYSNESIWYGVIPLADFKPLACSEDEPGAFIGRNHTVVQASEPTQRAAVHKHTDRTLISQQGDPTFSWLEQAFDRGEFISFNCGRGEGATPTTLVWGITYASSAPPTRRAEEWTTATETAGRASHREQLERMLLDK